MHDATSATTMYHLGTDTAKKAFPISTANGLNYKFVVLNFLSHFSLDQRPKWALTCQAAVQQRRKDSWLTNFAFNCNQASSLHDTNAYSIYP